MQKRAYETDRDGDVLKLGVALMVEVSPAGGTTVPPTRWSGKGCIQISVCTSRVNPESNPSRSTNHTYEKRRKGGALK